MLLCNLNDKLECALRKKFDIRAGVPVFIEWADDGSCIMSIIVGNVEDVFSLLDYERVEKLLLEVLGATDVQMLENICWPGNSLTNAFKKFKDDVGITDPKVTCGADLPEAYLAGWEAVWEQRTVVEITQATNKKAS